MKKIILLLCFFWLGSSCVWAKSIIARDTLKDKEQQAQSKDTEGLLPASDSPTDTYYSRTWRDKIKKTPHKLGKKHNKKRPKGNFIELDPLMVGLAFVIGMGFLLLIWFLFRGISNLTFGWAFLVAIGFALALFFWLLANSESVDTVAGYEYFIKFGIFAMVGLLLLLGGFIAMFGGMPNMGKFFLWGLILGGIALLLSIIFKNSVLNEIFPYWFR